MEHKLTILRPTIVEINFKVTTGENNNALLSMVLAQLDSIHKLGLYHNIADELHLEL